MKIEYAGKYNTVFIQDENNHRTPYDWNSKNIPQEVHDYVAENDLWSDEVKAQYDADHPAPTAEEIAQKAQNQINQDALKHLADTDWYEMREFRDPTKPTPADIIESRQLAREAIIK